MNIKVLEYQNVEKQFFGVPVLRDVSFDLREGQVLGLVGENGAGKSTLMNILGGVVRADAGRILLRGKTYQPRDPADALQRGIAFIHQELNLFTNLSIAENIFVKSFPKRIKGVPFISRSGSREKAKQLLEAVDLHLSPDTIVANLSQGERQLVEIAKALSLEASTIIFDEPTTSLTPKEVERLFEIINRLRAQGVSMIYISHALKHVLRLCDAVVVLRDGEVVGAGTKDDFTIERMIRLMVGRNLDQLYPPRALTPSAEIALEVKALSQPGVVRDISFTLHKGEVLGVSGLMGSGRTELARILFGLDSFKHGEIYIDGKRLLRPSPEECIRRGMAFLTENRREEGLLMNFSIKENIRLASLPLFVRSPMNLLDEPRANRAAKEAADAVRLDSRAKITQAVKTLSGGNQQKIVIAKWLMREPSVLIVDEPTRGIDVGAKYEIYSILRRLTGQGAGVLVISSEIEELIGICDRVLVMSNGEIKRCFLREEFDREGILRSALRGGAAVPS